MASKLPSYYYYNAFPHCRDFSIYTTNKTTPIKRPKRVTFASSITSSTKSTYNTLVSEAVRLLGPPARFEASKLKVVLKEEEMANESAWIIPRTYVLSHCDFTANLTLTISNVINFEQLRGWYSKDDVVAEWKKVDGKLNLHVHCYVSGPNYLMVDLAAEFRYHIFSKEMALVLEAILHGDTLLFRENPELMDSFVWVFFHSSSPKYNRLECWGPLKEAIKGKQEEQKQGFLSSPTTKEVLQEDRSPFSRLSSPFFFLFDSFKSISLITGVCLQRQKNDAVQDDKRRQFFN